MNSMSERREVGLGSIGAMAPTPFADIDPHLVDRILRFSGKKESEPSARKAGHNCFAANCTAAATDSSLAGQR